MNKVPDRLAVALADRYRIERELGTGGMATVYLAHDLKHDRKVALKVLKPELAAVLGADRFVIEIRTTAALQHPHILPLFDSGTADGFLFYVMPFIDGETLRAKLDRETQLGIDESVKIATNVADALDYAHRHGVVHRDIKPENILLHEGQPMVADFGIALAVSAAAGGRMTETGLSLGTPHYMSPEQATAEKEIGARSDIYSLASVLYEMLTGNPPHTGASAQQIIMKIVTEQAPPVTKLRKSVPPNVAAALEKALEKLPADRFDSARSFADALANVHFATGPEAAHTTKARPTVFSSFRGRSIAALLLLAVGAGAGWLLPARKIAEPAVTRFAVPVPGGHEMNGVFSNLAVSNDGRALAYFANGTLYVRTLDSDSARAIAYFPAACCPQFLKEDRTLLISDGFTLFWTVPVDGGAPTSIALRPLDQDLIASTWNDSLRIRRAGDTAWTRIETIASDSNSAMAAGLWAQLLDNGRLVLFTMMGPSMMWHDAKVVLQDMRSGRRDTIASAVTYGRYIPTGHVVYLRADGTVEALPYDLRRRRATGSAFVVLKGVRTAYWGGAGEIAISDAGTLAYVRGSSWQQHRLTWIDRQGTVLGTVGDAITAEGVRLSPDERYGVTYVASPNADISRFDLATGEQRRITFDTRTEDNPVWSPDGRRVTYRQVVTSRHGRILSRSADGQGGEVEVYTSNTTAVPIAWSKDGSTLVIGANRTLLLIRPGTQRVDTITRTASRGAGFSPDGRYLAYSSTETGRDEIYVTSYPGLADKQQISANGGRLPMWSARSSELFFLAGDTVMASTISLKDGFDWTTPRALFARPEFATLDYPMSVSGDGRRFLFPARNPDAAAREINVVLNWFQELGARHNQ